jgi:hypothetical protein
VRAGGRTTKEPLYLRLFRDPQLYELARYISYGGRRDAELKAKVEEMRAEHSGKQMMWPLIELTPKEEAKGLAILEPAARKLYKGLLGPMSEVDEYERYWFENKRAPGTPYFFSSVILSTVSVTNRRNDSFCMNCLENSVSSRSSGCITRFSAASSSMRGAGRVPLMNGDYSSHPATIRNPSPTTADDD